MKKFIYFSLTTLFISLSQPIYAQEMFSHRKKFSQCNDYGKYADILYMGADSDKLLRRAMQLCYQEYFSFFDPKTKTPLWTFEKITNQSNSYVEREDNFSPDPQVPYSAQAKLSDYKGSKFDRGHMAAAANMTNSESMKQSFYLTNMVPQVGPNMNRGIWKDLEETVRAFSSKNSEIIVLSGPIFKNQKQETIGNSQVWVPSHLFKVIYIPQKKEVKYYIIPNNQIVTRKTKNLDNGNEKYLQTTPQEAVNCFKVCNSEDFRVKEEVFIQTSNWKFNFK